MLKFILKRLFYMLIVVIAISFISFALLRLSPGDPAMMMLGDNATPEMIEAMREKLGLNQPFMTQYFIYVTNLLKGDLGTSILYGYSCKEVIFSRLPATATLSFISAIIILIIAIPIGIIAGAKQGSFFDFFATALVVLLQSMSVVWVAILLLLIFSVKLNILPAVGYKGLSDPKYLVMPVIACGYRTMAMMVRMGRSGMIDVMSEDYIKCTYARGMSKFDVYTKYAFKNALIPITTLYGLQISGMLAGTVVIETVYNIPGIGSMLVNAVGHRDYPLVQSSLVVTAIMFAVITLIVDIVNTFIDRRMQLN
ncbi:MAG: ABC transporter permease [Solobacterium sp.]|nr:ABC transporter permease [Solobacterium sp.]